ncbi:restriction endonuclease subunit S [Xanthomonas translucens]|uniref:restriction endonuclease subunit S n=1 Tax=Xanthomonas campestris pv. translucens TaxID=343 RepID=UPI00071E8D90|nr:restriction endonuclease subunit S [Xanthomonas translucens]KTF41122.1 restriction endonuclease subunit S [Xanthomonas translucens pv. translucens]MCT8274780.1 restriction endonuclease subunit S [Xanthomonas translucens pv. translucens]MCT8278500.1 restriction endonuclease subunit S [Xanthomonas translucens pv. translucens]MCT8307666.1 restriction endonuclease subunit S [Xanthomonas translucens pv. translucens]UPU49025.1 restriction endonuclease subunit S [Xanthomonas translucens pv. undulo
MLPKDWRRLPFGDVASIGSGQVNPKNEPYASMLHIGPENIESGSGRILSPKKCSELGLISGKYEFDENAVVYSKIRPNLNKVCHPGFRGVCSADAYPIWPNSKKLIPEYLKHYMLGSDFIKRAVACSMRTGMPKVNREDLDLIPISIPPLDEQRRISHILSTWDQAIATTDRLLKNSQKQMDILLRDLTLGTHRTTSTPSSWENFTLGELGRTYSGLSGKKGEDFGSGAKFIPYTNVFKNNRIDIEDFSLVKISEGENQTRVKSGDIIFTISSETPNEVGMASVLLDDVDELYLNSFCFGYRLNEFTTLLPEYAAFALRAPHIRALMTQLAQGSTRYNISKANVMRMKLTLPSITEQKRITPILNEAHSTVKNFRDQLARLKQEKAILMSQLLTGKRRVRLPADETASA